MAGYATEETLDEALTRILMPIGNRFRKNEASIEEIKRGLNTLFSLEEKHYEETIDRLKAVEEKLCIAVEKRAEAIVLPSLPVTRAGKVEETGAEGLTLEEKVLKVLEENPNGLHYNEIGTKIGDQSPYHRRTATALTRLRDRGAAEPVPEKKGCWRLARKDQGAPP